MHAQDVRRAAACAAALPGDAPMNARNGIASLVAVALLTFAAWTANAGEMARAPLAVAAPAGFADRMARRLGDDFVLGAYPPEADTLEAVFRHLAERHPVGSLLGRWERVFGTVVTIERDGRTGPLYAFAANADFTGDVVYAVAIAYPADPRAIYVQRGRN